MGDGTSTLYINTAHGTFETFTKTDYGPYWVVVQDGAVRSVADGSLMQDTVQHVFHLNCTEAGKAYCEYAATLRFQARDRVVTSVVKNCL